MHFPISNAQLLLSALQYYSHLVCLKAGLLITEVLWFNIKAITWENAPLHKMVGGLCIPGIFSLIQPCKPNGLENQKCFLNCVEGGGVPSWHLIHHLVQMDGRWKLLQAERYCSRRFCEMNWGILPSSKWKSVFRAIDTWAVNLSCQWLQWIWLHDSSWCKRLMQCRRSLSHWLNDSYSLHWLSVLCSKSDPE